MIDINENSADGTHCRDQINLIIETERMCHTFFDDTSDVHDSPDPFSRGAEKGLGTRLDVFSVSMCTTSCESLCNTL